MAMATAPFWVIVEERFSVGDTLYIQDLDKVGLLDDILCMEDGNTILVIEMEETFMLAPMEDEFIINLDDDNTQR